MPTWDTCAWRWRIDQLSHRANPSNPNLVLPVSKVAPEVQDADGQWTHGRAALCPLYVPTLPSISRYRHTEGKDAILEGFLEEEGT